MGLPGVKLCTGEEEAEQPLPRAGVQDKHLESGGDILYLIQKEQSCGRGRLTGKEGTWQEMGHPEQGGVDERTSRGACTQPVGDDSGGAERSTTDSPTLAGEVPLSLHAAAEPSKRGHARGTWAPCPLWTVLTWPWVTPHTLIPFKCPKTVVGHRHGLLAWSSAGASWASASPPASSPPRGSAHT